MAVIACAFTWGACEEDEPAKPVNYCVDCVITLMGVTSSQEICNQEGNAYIDGTFVGNYAGWIENMTEQGYTCQ